MPPKNDADEISEKLDEVHESVKSVQERLLTDEQIRTIMIDTAKNVVAEFQRTHICQYSPDELNTAKTAIGIYRRITYGMSDKEISDMIDAGKRVSYWWNEGAKKIGMLVIGILIAGFAILAVKLGNQHPEILK